MDRLSPQQIYFEQIIGTHQKLNTYPLMIKIARTFRDQVENGCIATGFLAYHWEIPCQLHGLQLSMEAVLS